VKYVCYLTYSTENRNIFVYYFRGAIKKKLN